MTALGCISLVKMIGVRVGYQDHVHVPEPRIGGTGDCVAGIVKNSDPGGVFEKQGSIEGAKLTRALPERCDPDVLSVSQRVTEGNDETEKH
jgi:hypothetical protein